MSSQWFGQHGAQPANADQRPVVTSILKDFSAEALGELRTWLEQNPPAVTISSIIGFTQFAARQASVGTQEATTSTTYADLATAGPTITGLANGQYLVLIGGIASSSGGGASSVMSVMSNSAAVTSDDTYTNMTSFTPVMVAVTRTLSSGSNTLKCVYRTNILGQTATFTNRWIVALKYANA